MTDRTSPLDREADPAAPWTPAMRGVLLLALAVGLLMGWLSRRVALTMDGDDATYLALSRSIASGHYADTFLVGSPPHAQYPPLFPLWLLLVRVMAGPGLGAAILANLLLLTLTATIVADGLRRLGSAWLGIVAAAIVACNPALIDLATQLRSELLYIACVAVALWCSLREHQSGGSFPHTVGMSLAALGAFLARTAGVTVIPAVALPWLVRREWRRLVLGSIAALLVIGGWLGYTRAAARDALGKSYGTELQVGERVLASRHLLPHLIGNAKWYFVRAPVQQFSIPDIPEQPVDNGVEAALLAVLALVGAASLVRPWLALPAHVFFSLVVLLAFPWGVARLMTALVPFIVILLLIGARRVAGRASLVLGVILLGFGVLGQLQAVERRQACRATEPYVDPRCYDDAARGYIAAIHFVRDSLPTDAVIASMKPSSVYLGSDRKGFPLELFTDQPPSSLLAPTGPVTGILLSNMMAVERERIGPALLKVCTALRLLVRYPPGVLVLAPRRPDDPGGDACQPLRDYISTPKPNPDLAPM